MGKSFCELPLLFSTQISEYGELHSTYIATCVLNGFLCYSAVMLTCVASLRHMENFIPAILLLFQYNTIQYNTIQYNTIQYNTIQYNTIQYNTIQ